MVTRLADGRPPAVKRFVNGMVTAWNWHRHRNYAPAQTFQLRQSDSRVVISLGPGHLFQPDTSPEQEDRQRHRP